MSYIAVAGIAVSVGTSLLGNEASKKTAQKQIDAMRSIEMAKIAEQEKVELEKLRVMSETQRIGFMSDSLEKYREALQKESTIRLRDSWIYVASLGCGTGVLYAISLMYSKSGSNGNA